MQDIFKIAFTTGLIPIFGINLFLHFWLSTWIMESILILAQNAKATFIIVGEAAVEGPEECGLAREGGLQVAPPP